MISFVIVVIYFLAAIAAPILVKTGVLDPYSTNQDLLDENTLPIGDYGGISWDHPLGVEPGTGRDVLSRVWYGITFSLGDRDHRDADRGRSSASCWASSPAPPAAGSTPSSAGSST